jgi:hypothetical protein
MIISKKSPEKEKQLFSPIKTNGFKDSTDYDFQLIKKNPEIHDANLEKR